jgi:hypothetical protein
MILVIMLVMMSGDRTIYNTSDDACHDVRR